MSIFWALIFLTFGVVAGWLVCVTIHEVCKRWKDGCRGLKLLI